MTKALLAASLFLFLPCVSYSQGLPFTSDDPNLQETLDYLYNQIRANKAAITNNSGQITNIVNTTTVPVTASQDGVIVTSPTTNFNFIYPFAVTNPGSGQAKITLKASGVVVGTYGTATAIPSFTVNSTGIVTAASNITIPIDTMGLSTNTLSASTQSLQSQISNFNVIAGTQTVTWIRDNFLGQVTGAQTAFTLSYVPTSANAIMIVLDGLLQSGTSDYTYALPRTITMTTAPPANASSFFAIYTVNTSTYPNVFITNSTNNPGGYNIWDSTDIHTIRSSTTYYGPVTMSSAAITSVYVASITFGDGTVLTSTAGLQASGGSGGGSSTQTIAWVTDNFLGQVTGSQKNFTLSQTPSSSTAILVVLNGLLQSGASDYTYTAPTTIAMTTAPPSNSSRFYVQYTVNTSTLPSVAVLNITNAFTATQTVTALGVSSTVPTAMFVVGASTGVLVLANGHTEFFGTPPVISACGSTPNGSVVGTDQSGTITVGGGAVTSCTLTFNALWTNAPSCNVSDNSASISIGVTSISAASFTVGTSLSVGGGSIYYNCFGWRKP